jgi:hypothetical protein
MDKVGFKAQIESLEYSN